MEALRVLKGNIHIVWVALLGDCIVAGGDSAKLDYAALIGDAAANLAAVGIPDHKHGALNGIAVRLPDNRQSDFGVVVDVDDMAVVLSANPALPHIGGHLVSIQGVGLGDPVQARLQVAPGDSARAVGVEGAVIAVAARSNTLQLYAGALQDLRLIGGVPHAHRDRSAPVPARLVVPIRIGRGEDGHGEHSDQHDHGEQTGHPLVDQLCHCWIYLLWMPGNPGLLLGALGK